MTLPARRGGRFEWFAGTKEDAAALRREGRTPSDARDRVVQPNFPSGGYAISLHGDMVVGQHSDPFCETSMLFMAMYYVMSEVAPSFLLLYVLRDLPKKPSTNVRRATESTPLVT